MIFPRFRSTCFLLCTAVLASITASAQIFLHQGGKLVGSGAIGYAGQGSKVALSAGGNTALEGGPGDDNGIGAAWVFTRDDKGDWAQQGNKLVGTGFIGQSQEGFSVALSADGNTALESGANDNGGIGAMWVFTRGNNGTWTQQGSKLVGSGAVGMAGEGFSVALSPDGNTALDGVYEDNSFTGAVWVFTRDKNGDWSQQGSKLVGSGAVGFAAQGWSVAISGDRNTALVDGPFDNNSAGAFWVFTRDSAGIWKQLGRKEANPGNAVALSTDGITAMVGGGNQPAGAVWPFVRPPGGP